MKRKIIFIIFAVIAGSRSFSFAKTYARLYAVRFNDNSMWYGTCLFFHMSGDDGIIDTNDDKCLLINGGGTWDSIPPPFYDRGSNSNVFSRGSSNDRATFFMDYYSWGSIWDFSGYS